MQHITTPTITIGMTILREIDTLYNHKLQIAIVIGDKIVDIHTKNTRFQ